MLPFGQRRIVWIAEIGFRLETLEIILVPLGASDYDATIFSLSHTLVLAIGNFMLKSE